MACVRVDALLAALLLATSAACGARTGLSSEEPLSDAGVSRVDGAASDGSGGDAESGSCPTEMAELPAGDFTLVDAKLAAHVERYCLDRHLTTSAEYAECVAAGVCETTVGAPICDFTEGVKGMADHPVTCVRLSDAETYCRWKGKRLPTDAEMEWAARNGPADTIYPWGNDPPTAFDSPERLCWSAETSRSSTCSVGSFPGGASFAGILDLAGNAYAWTSTPYEGDPAQTLNRGCPPIETSEHYARASYRSWGYGINRSGFGSFRCAMDLGAAR